MVIHKNVLLNFREWLLLKGMELLKVIFSTEVEETGVVISSENSRKIESLLSSVFYLHVDFLDKINVLLKRMS